MKLHHLVITVGTMILGLSAWAQPTKKLEAEIRDLLQGFHGQAGVFVKYLPTGKIPILLGVMDKIRKQELTYHQEMIYKDSLLYPGVDILGSYKDGEKIELSKLLMLMLSTSDNTASLWLQSVAGGGTRINQILDSLGYTITRVNSRTPGREDNRNVYGWGQTSPREMARLFEQIYRRQIFSDKACDRMLRLMGRNYWDEEALSQLPPEIFVACKNGAVDESRSETMLVMAPHGAYIMSVITKNQQDTSWNSDNEGWVLARKLSRLLWTSFEPRYQWVPELGVDGKPAAVKPD
jgi:beta-lactamase class A